MPRMSAQVALPNLDPVIRALRELRTKSSKHVERFLLWMVRDMTPCRDSIELLQLRARVDDGGADQRDLDTRVRMHELRMDRSAQRETPNPAALTRMAATQLAARGGELLGAAELCVSLHARHALAQAVWSGKEGPEQEQAAGRAIQRMLDSIAAVAEDREPPLPMYQLDYDEAFDDWEQNPLPLLRSRRGPEAPPSLELLLELGFEGGSWSLYRYYDAEGKPHYSQELNQALLVGFEPDAGAPAVARGEVDLRRALLDLLNQGPPTFFTPVRVHRDVIPLLEAVRAFERQVGPESRHFDSRWREIFGMRMAFGRPRVFELPAADARAAGSSEPTPPAGPGPAVEREQLPLPGGES